MVSRPLLELSLTPDDNVRIRRGNTTSEMLWRQAVQWWADGRQLIVTDDAFFIPLSEFIVRMGWLRAGWTTQGGEVDLSPTLRARLADSKELQDRFRQLATRSSKVPQIDLAHLHLARTLTPEQVSNVSQLLAMDNGANFSVPGAGKTTTELVVWRLLQMNGVVGRLLVISPRSAFEAWTVEPSVCFETPIRTQVLDSQAIDPSADILIVNYEQLEQGDKRNRVRKWLLDNNAMIVMDEAHRVKGGGASVRWRACRELAQVAKRVDLLTGTPMPQGFEDLRNLFSLSWPQIPKTCFEDSLLQSLRRDGVFVRTTKSELGLPQPKIVEEFLSPGPIQGQIYSALCRSYFGTFRLTTSDAQTIERKGRAVMTLLAAATNPGLLFGLESDHSWLNLQWPPRDVEESAQLLDVVQNYAGLEMPSKYEWIRRFVQVAADEHRKVLVWSTFVGNLRALARVLQPFAPALVFGGTSSSDRVNEIKRFRHDSACSVLLTNPQTLGEGISLHKTCHDAVYVDRSYNAGLYLQSLDRIHRLGLKQDEETRIYLLGTRGTIDQRVSSRLRTKVDRLARALDDTGLVRVSMPDDDVQRDPEEVFGMDRLDLDDLFAHLIPHVTSS